jgi:hypothetical protein
MAKNEGIASSAKQIQEQLIDGGRNSDNGNNKQLRESRSILIALQFPMMLYILSVMMCLTGPWAIVLTPLASKDKTDHTRIKVFFVVVNLLMLVSFFGCSSKVYQLSMQNNEKRSRNEISEGGINGGASSESV